MFSHLPQSRIHSLVTAFSDLQITYDTAARVSFFSGIPASYTALLPIGQPPAIQLLGDLARLNGLERLADGSVPLFVWLMNAAVLAHGTESEKVFLRAADDIVHRVTSEPRIDLANVSETKEALVHQDDMVSYQFMAAGLAVAASVAKLRVPRYEDQQKISLPQPVIYLGTGWLITSTLLITNHHVINARKEEEPAASPKDFELQAKAMEVRFDFNDTNEAGTIANVLSLEAFEPVLDYAIVRIDNLDRAPLLLAPKPLQLPPNGYVPVNIVQHPGQDSKKYAIRNNLVSAVSGTDIRYFTDTKLGSSGAPVLDDTWRVVALHRGSTFADNVRFQGRTTAWVNLGTGIHPILSDLRNRYPAVAAELLN